MRSNIIFVQEANRLLPTWVVIVALVVLLLGFLLSRIKPMSEEEARAYLEERKNAEEARLAATKRAEEEKRAQQEMRAALLREALRLMELPSLGTYSGAPYLPDAVVVIERDFSPGYHGTGHEARLNDLTWRLSPGISRPDEIGAVVYLEWRPECVGNYSNGAGAYKHVCTMKIIDARKQTQVTERSFVGSDPPRTMTADNIVVPGYGTRPDSEIEAFLTRLPSATGVRPPSFR